MFEKSKSRYLLLFVILLLIPNYLRANVNYYFNQISTEQGLSQPWVRCILNDSNGLLWIGTQSGLNSFDQYDLKSYFHERALSTSLPSNQINFIMEDSLQTIWIGTEGGVVTYNGADNNFIPVLFNGSILKAYSYLLVPDGIIFGGESVLYKYAYASHHIQPLEMTGCTKGNYKFNDLFYWKENSYIVATKYAGIFVYNSQNKRLNAISFCEEKNNSSVYVDSKKRVWIATFNKGVACYDTNGQRIYQYKTSNSNLSNDIILDILEKEGQMWFATDGGGINVLNTDMQSFKVIGNQEDNYSLPVNSIYVLYNDNDDNLWAGTIRGGLLGIKQTYIQTYDVQQNSAYGLSNKSVISLFRDDGDLLWIGTDGGGLNSYNYRTNRFEHIQSTAQEKVVSITSYSPNELLVSFFSKGLYLFDKKSHRLSPFTLVDKKTDRKECASGCSVYINRYAKDKFYFLAGQIYLYDKAIKKFSRILPVNEEQERLLQLMESNDSVSYLFGQYHIARLEHRTNKLETVVRLKEVILAACCDYRGNIWIGTGTGLTMYDATSQKLQEIKTSLFSNVSSLTPDNRGRIWIGAQNLLFCYDIVKKRFVILGESDGIYPNALLHIPTIKDSSFLYLGGTSGLIKINKNISFEDNYQPVVKLMDVLVNGSSVMRKIDKREMKISIPWDHTSLVIKLNVKEKDAFRKKIYRYSIVGLDKEYTESYNHILNVRSLPPGNYSIAASCSTRNGDWGPTSDILFISVVPPWWKTTWFIVLSIIFVLSVFLLIILFIIRQNKTKLKGKMEEYERKAYEEKISFLINVSHELRTPLTLIYAPLKRLLDSCNGDEYLNKQLTSIYKQAKQMKNIVNAVLDMRRMEVQQDTLRIAPHELNQWLCLIADDFKNEFHAKGIELQYDLDESMPKVPFDENKCEIVISNLLMNALKFSEPQSTVVLSTCQTADGHYARVSVSDQGIGLSSTDTSKLFMRFYQGDHGKTGSGIGLSYSKVLIEKHNGRIGALNKENEKGAVFFFELPIDHVASPAASAQPAIDDASLTVQLNPVKAELFDIKSYTLLLVEDEVELSEFLKDVLKEHFKHVYTALNGEEALQLIGQYYPDIVVSDVMMPRMDGFELCKRIKSNPETSHLPVILQTARHESESIYTGYELGADAYVSKPFDIDFLLIIIRNQLRNRLQMKVRYKTNTAVESSQEEISCNADEQFMIKLNLLIEANMSNSKLNAQFLASNMGMGRSSFYSKIKILTGAGLSEHINKLRVEKAAQLLLTTNLSISEIADQTGFAYQAYFSSVFKLFKGVSPSRYRQNEP